MKQVGILPSGCQIIHNSSILYFNENRIFYAATLAVYVLNASTFIIEKILSLNPRAISSISVCPSNNNLLLVSSIDGSICVWNVDEEEVITKVTLPGVVFVEWDPHTANHCSIIAGDGMFKAYYWDVNKGAAGISEMFCLKNDTLRHTVARWNPNTKGQLAVGFNNGSVFVLKQHISISEHVILQVTNRNVPVVDLQWDRLSAIYLLVAYQTFLSLWDIESKAEIHVFEKQTVNITSIAWLDWTAGNFVSANSKNNTLKVWNASQKQPLETIKIVGDGGIFAMTFSPGKRRLLYSCTDGAVCVYNLQKMQLEYRTNAGHTETIFDCKVSPISPNMFATASYDGTCKIWATSDLSLQKTLHTSGEIIYCLEWSPKGNIIAACNSIGMITMWDVESGRELARYLHHNKPSYSLAWNKLVESYVCSTSADGNLVMFNVNIEALYDPHSSHVPTGSRRKGEKGTHLTPSDIRFRYFHPAPVFGVAWCPTHAPIIVTCCQDGNVRIFNHLLKNQFIYILQGHSARAFGAAWSSLVPGLLATGSDDQNILTWEIDLSRALTIDTREPLKISSKNILQGHKNNVRALHWSYEHRNLLVSGSWDSTIRLWDAMSGTCLYVLSDHVADVYAVVSHPDRPFTYYSTSRDTTIRVWELEGTFTRLRYNTVWDGNFDRVLEMSSKNIIDTSITLSETISEFSSSGTTAQHKMITMLPTHLCGRGSLLLNGSLLELSDKNDDLRAESKSKSPINEVSSKQESKGNTPRELSTPRVEHYIRNYSKDKMVVAKNFYKIFAFYNGSSGSMDVWENAIALLQLRQQNNSNISNSGSPRMSMRASISIPLLRPPHMRIVYNENEIMSKAKSEARRLESTKMNYRKQDMSAKMEEQYRASAFMHARTGDFMKYCNIMIELGDWTAALSMAPCVSMDYWKILSNRYAQHLISNASEQCVPYLLGIGKDADAVEFYLRRRDSENAMIVAKMSEQRTDLIPDYLVSMNQNNNSNASDNNGSNSNNGATFVSPNKSSTWSNNDVNNNNNNGNNNNSNNNNNNSTRERTDREIGESRTIVKVAANHAASFLLNSSKPILAAAQFLSIDDVHAAVNTLANNNEYDMAYALAYCFDLDYTPYLIDMADRAASMNAIDLAVDILSTLDTMEEDIGLLLSRYCTESKTRKIISQRSLRSLQAWVNHAKEEEEIGSDANAVVSYVIAREYKKAVTIGLSVLKKYLREPLDLTPSSRKLLRGLKYVKATELDEPLRNLFLCYILWYSAHEAASLGLWDTACNMLAIVLDYATRCSFPVNETDIEYQLLFFYIYSGNRNRAISSIETIINMANKNTNSTSNSNANSPINSEMNESLKSLRNLLKDPTSMSLFDPYTVLTPSNMKSSQLRNQEGIWGINTATILKEMQKISDAHSLPSLINIYKKGIGSGNSNSKSSSSSGKSEVDIVAELNNGLSASILQGSILPASNQQLKSTMSCISCKRIQGCAFQLNEQSNVVASVNEVISWRRVNPYSPTMTGEIIYL